MPTRIILTLQSVLYPKDQEDYREETLPIFLFLLLAFPVMAQEPDGLLLFITRETDARSIHVLNATTDEQRLISDLKGNIADAGWAPDGRIWAVDTVVEDQRRLRFFDVASGEESTFSEPLLLDTCLPALDWSPTGDHFAYFTGTYSKPILNLLNLEEETSYTIPDTRRMPLWSPDGRYMAFDDQILATADGSKPSAMLLRGSKPRFGKT